MELTFNKERSRPSWNMIMGEPCNCTVEKKGEEREEGNDLHETTKIPMEQRHLEHFSSTTRKKIDEGYYAEDNYCNKVTCTKCNKEWEEFGVFTPRWALEY